ncbi:MAG: TetR/AcrR family transcriptional regulator [Acidobacteria bacterium]|nr:TetR/AcrR family transcriptional regulator [Acidobacteriota bacterium]
MARQTPRKDHLIEVALRLFSQKGYHACGIDLILAEAGVSKATLYKHFPTKEDLILAVLERRHQDLSDEQTRRIEEIQSQNPNASCVELIGALFDGLDAWFQGEHFCGCNFIHAAGEYQGAQDPIHQMAKRHKLSNLKVVETLLGPKRKDMALPILLLMEGAIVLAHVCQCKEAAREAKQAAFQLLKGS